VRAEAFSYAKRMFKALLLYKRGLQVFILVFNS
jgi:hypothetical protein